MMAENRSIIEERNELIRKMVEDAGGYITQSQIAAQLTGKYKLSQSGISRVLRDQLGYERDPDSGRWVYKKELDRSKQIQELKEFLKDTNTVSHQCNTLVLKTKHGFATAIATQLSETYPEKIIGTIAQDDTLLLFITHGFEKEFCTLFADENENMS